MSYARFGLDGSDVYIYANANGGIDCCGCILHDQLELPNFRTFATISAHITEHIEAGHHVPDDVLPEILHDRKKLVRDGILDE